MRVLACGGRDFNASAVVFAELDWWLSGESDFYLIAGGASGADHHALIWALERGVFFVIFPADWDQHGNRAEFLRNSRMLREGRPDVVVAFWGGRGTAMMKALARADGVPVIDGVDAVEEID